MRVRVNFTLDLREVEQYNEAFKAEHTKEEVRKEIQEDCIRLIMNRLEKRGVEVHLIGRNNVYDSAQRLTVAEHLVKGA